MTETIRYTRIFTEDLGLGDGTAEVQLADGRVVTMTHVSLASIARDAAVMSYNTVAVQNVVHPSFAHAVNTLGSTVATLVIADLQTVSADLTVPTNLTLQFVDQGQLAVSTGATLTINGRIVAPNVQIFTGSGTVNITNTFNPLEYAYWKGGSGLPYLLGFRGGGSDTTTPFTLQDTTGSTGRRLSLEASGAGGAEVQMLPGSSATPSSQVTNDLILKHVPGTDLEQLRIRTTSNTYVVDSTYSNIGTARALYFQMGGRIEPSAISGRNALVLYADASVDIHASTYTADGKTWGSTYCRFVDPGDSGTTKVVFDTRTTTPADNSDDAAFIEFRRGGTAKWSMGLNVSAAADDSFDIYSSSGKFIKVMERNSGPVLEFGQECSADPNNPDADNQCRIYLIDNGAGKTVLKARFRTGAAVTIATEP